jgi:hypothetical protein
MKSSQEITMTVNHTVSNTYPHSMPHSMINIQNSDLSFKPLKLPTAVASRTVPNSPPHLIACAILIRPVVAEFESRSLCSFPSAYSQTVNGSRSSSSQLAANASLIFNKSEEADFSLFSQIKQNHQLASVKLMLLESSSLESSSTQSSNT